jgi:Fe2+ transport system protein B
MGIPLLLFLLNTQLDIQNKSAITHLPSQISMTVDYLGKHSKITTMDDYYEKLQQLKIVEINLKMRTNLYKNNKKMLDEIKSELVENQRLQEDKLKAIYDLRAEIEKDFLTSKESELSMQLIKRARFLWSHNTPIAVFFLLFIFLLYSSFIFAKMLSPRGLYDHLVKYEDRNTLLLNGIEEIQLPVSIDGQMVTSYRYHSSDLQLMKSINKLSEQLDIASRKLKSNYDSAKSNG